MGIVRENLSFKRGLGSKESLGIGAKEINRDFDTLAKNFIDHFSKWDIQFLAGHQIFRKFPKIFSAGPKKYTIVFNILIDAKDSHKIELLRKRKQLKKWFEKYTPYSLKRSEKETVWYNNEAKSGFQRRYSLYLADRD